MDNGREFCFCSYCGAKVYHEVQRIQMTGTVSLNNAPTVDSLFERATLQLQDREFDSALETCNRILDISPYYAPAYMARYCAKNNLRHITDIGYIYNASLDLNKDIQNALRFADYKIKPVYQNLVLKSAEQQQFYAHACSEITSLNNKISEYSYAISQNQGSGHVLRLVFLFIFGLVALIVVFFAPPVSLVIIGGYVVFAIVSVVSQSKKETKLRETINNYKSQIPYWKTQKIFIEQEFQQAVNK